MWRTKVNNTGIQIAGSDLDLGDVGLRDAIDTEINPALRSAQSDIISDLQLIDASIKNATATANEPGKGVNVSDVAVTLLASNANRKAATFVNDHSDAVYIHLSDVGVAVNSGILLNAAGSSYEINQTNLYTGAVQGIRVVTGVGKVCVTEL